jgi:hypothetical protein
MIAAMIASLFFWYLIPVWLLLFFVVLLGILAVLGRIRGGRYLRPIMAGLMKVPLVGRGLKKLSESAIERSNPALASAIKKLERTGAMRDPQRLQKALSTLSASERRAWMEAADQQQSASSEISNRQLRRQLERQGLGQSKPKGKAKSKGKKKGSEDERGGRGKPGRRRRGR